MRRTVVVAWKFLKEMVREPSLFSWVLLIPVFFLFICWIGYSREPRPVTRHLMLSTDVFLDSGAGNLSIGAAARNFVTELEALRYDDGRPVFNVERSGWDGLDEALRAKRIDLAVLLLRSPAGTLGYRVRGDATSMAFIAASSRFDEAFAGFSERASGKPFPIRTETAGLPLESPRSDFEDYAPGMMLFAVLLLIPQTATLIGREIRKGSFKRYRLAALPGHAYLGGVVLSQTVAAVFLSAAMLAAAVLFGFPITGSVPLAFLVLILVGVSSIGFGLLTACLFSSDSAAINLGATVTMLQVFLSGSFFPMGSPELFPIGGHAVGLFDFLPATHAFTALRLVLSGGAVMGDIGFSLAGMTVLTAVIFAASAAVFSRRLRVRENR